MVPSVTFLFEQSTGHFQLQSSKSQSSDAKNPLGSAQADLQKVLIPKLPELGDFLEMGVEYL